MELSYLNNISVGNKLTTFFRTDWSQDGRIFILTDINISVLQLDLNILNPENLFTFLKTEIILSNYRIAEETGINIEEEIYLNSRESFYETILDQNITPTLKNLAPTPIVAINAAWSPSGDIKTNILLGVVTNIGNVEIYLQKFTKWILCVNITKYWVKHLKNTSWTKNIENSNNVKCATHIKRVNEALATCFVWGKLYYENNTIFNTLIVSHKLGQITIWKIVNNSIDIEPVLIHNFQTSLDNIKLIHFCSSNQLDWLILSNLEGIINALPVKNFDIYNFKVENNPITIWEHKDIAVNKFIDFKIDNFLCLLTAKGPFIIFSALNDEQKLVCIKYIDMKKINVTGIIPYEENYFIVSTMVGTLHLLEIKILKDNFNLAVHPIKTDLKWDYHACYGLIKSPSNILLGIVTYPCKMTDHLIVRNTIQINFMLNNNFNIETLLNLEDPIISRNIPECVEILRCISAKSNNLSLTCLKQFNVFDSCPIEEIRIIYWVSSFCHTFTKGKPEFKIYTSELPSPDSLKSIIFFKHRIEQIKKLINNYNNTNILSPISMNSLYLLYDSVKHFCQSDVFSKYFIEPVNNDLVTIEEKLKELPNLTNNIKCVWCDNELTSKLCSGGHPDQRCCISGIQIAGVAKWECRKCHLPADEHIEEDSLFCPLCSIQMINVL